MRLITIGDIISICMGVVMIAMGLYGIRIGEILFGLGLFGSGVVVVCVTWVIMEEDNFFGSDND